MLTPFLNEIASSAKRFLADQRLRRHLAGMPDYLVADAGLDRGAIEQELATRPIWETLSLAGGGADARRGEARPSTEPPRAAFVHACAV